MNWLMLVLALGIGSASGVASSLLSEKVIRRSERRRYIRETLADVRRES